MSVIGNEFSGLPIADLIGGPLYAACDAQVRLAKATSDFINTVGFNPEIGADGKPTGKLEPRQVDFSFWQPLPISKMQSSEVLATATVTLAGTTGSVDSITIDGVEVLDAPVPFNGDTTQTAHDVAAKINGQN